MYQPVLLFIGFRYIRKRAADRFSRFVSWLSTIGIALGMIALVTVLSVMNGFERDLQNNILGLIPLMILSSSTGFIDPQLLPENTVKLLGVNRIAPLTTGDVVLQSAHGVAMGVMLGIEPSQYDPLTPYILNVKQTDLKSGRYNVILGEQLAKLLDINSGDRLRVIVPSVGQFTPIGRLPNLRLFNVIDTFAANSEVDKYLILVNILDASRLMNYPLGNITGWRLWLNDPIRIDKINLQKLPKFTILHDWRARKGEFFLAVRMEKNIMELLLSLIVVVATFNIITSLCLVVIEKKREVAILLTQGMMPLEIMAVFMIQGASAGITGVIIGTVLGVLLTSLLNNLISIIGIPFNGIPLPVAIEPLLVIGISLVVISITLLSTFYPSYQAAATQPTEALRYE